nr:ASKHA domain-containing protein [uncultured Acetatifactor sp.]
MAIVTVNEITYKVVRGAGLGKLLADAAVMNMPCGGHGRCGKCKVTVRGAVSELSHSEKQLLTEEEIRRGIRLACCVKVEGDCVVSLATAGDGQIKISGDMPKIQMKPGFQTYGFVLDIGTTTLAARLYDVRGTLLAEGSCLNPQSSWGADVISRIEAAIDGADKVIAEVICAAVDDLLSQLSASAGISPAEIDGMVVTGNTVMLHLLTRTSTEPLSHAPFAAERLFGETVSAGELGITKLSPEAGVYLAPCASAFVGADLITALLASGICENDSTQLLTDIGTNGEMALWHRGKLTCCSTAAGPAFEGAGISMGMGGSAGAIDKVIVQNGALTAHVIGGGLPRGICGSGIVDATACLLEICLLDETGYMEEDSVMILPPVSLSRKDIRMVQLAKAAIHAGIRTLLSSAGLDCGEVSRLVIAGGFGSYLDAKNAGKIELLPAEMVSRIHVAGNAALSGAAMLLLNQDSRASCEGYAKQAKVLELSSDPVFSEEYMERMMF